MDVKITVPLMILMLGQWSLVIISACYMRRVVYTTDNCLMTSLDTVGMSLAHPFSSTDGGKTLSTFNRALLAMFIYDIVFDTFIFLLVTWKLAFPMTLLTPLVSRILQDGLTYFLIV